MIFWPFGLMPRRPQGKLMVDIWFHGQACFRIKGHDATVVLDPYDADFTGLAALKLSADIVCVSHDHQDHNNAKIVEAIAREEQVPERSSVDPFVINGPGEYEILGMNVVGVDSFHDDNGGAERGRNTIYHLTVDDVNIVHLGDLGQKKLTQEQVEQLSSCDVLLIPVGSVYTISGGDAPGIIAQLEPKIVIPMHYKLPGLKFSLDDVGVFLSTMGKENLGDVPKLSLSRERLPEELEVVVLAKQ